MTPQQIEELEKQTRIYFFDLLQYQYQLDNAEDDRYKVLEEEQFWKQKYRLDEKIENFITTLLEKQREEYVEMIENIDGEGESNFYNGEEYMKDRIINLIKSHDKTS